MSFIRIQKTFLALLFCLTFPPAGDALYAHQADIADNKDSLVACLRQEKWDIDSNADAVILYEQGTVLMHRYTLTYTVERTIKILSENAAAEVGTIAIPAADRTTIKNVTGITYNLEGGKLSAKKIDKTDMLTDNITDKVKALKFNLPLLKAGSVLHYSFTLEYMTFIGVPEWNFQHDFPTLYSGYDVSIPNYYIYSDMSRTSVPFTLVKREKDLDDQQAGKFNVSYGDKGANNTIWVRRNVSAMKKEPFCSGMDNYQEQVRLQFTGLVNVQRPGIVYPLLKSWDQVNESMYRKGDIYSKAYAANGFLKDKVAELTDSISLPLEKAKAIYCYVRDHFVPDIDHSTQAVDLHAVFYKQRGNVRDINILLTALLRKAHLNSEPVIMATKPGAALSPFFPDLDDVNYTVSKVNIGGKDYFLDASQKYLPFGMLLPECYNGYSRVINEKGYAVTLSPDDLVDQNVVLATLSPDTADNNIFRLEIEEKMGNVSALEYRKSWKGDESEAEKTLSAAFSNDKFSLDSIHIDHLSDPDKPLIIHYTTEAEIRSDVLYLNPFFERFFRQNPFTAMDRRYPIELGHQYQCDYFLSFRLPEGYLLDDYPQSKMMKLEGDAMTFRNLVQFDKEANRFSISSRFSTATTSLPVAAYPGLRSFFEQMIAAQNAQIVLKKIK